MARVRGRKRRELKSEINIVPLLDVFAGVVVDIHGNRTHYHAKCRGKLARCDGFKNGIQ